MSETQPQRLLPPLKSAWIEERQSVLLQFPEGSVAPSGEYLCRGGVAWPERNPEGGVMGFALLAARHARTGVIHVLEQREWCVVDPVVEPSGDISPLPALSPFFADCWARCCCRTFYWQGQGLTRKDYGREIRASLMVEPKPHLPEAQWASDEEMLAALARLGACGRLLFKAASPLHRAMEANEADPALVHAPLRALMAAVCGLAKIHAPQDGEA